MIGTPKCQGFIGLHKFSRAYWGGKFVGITKKTWADAYMALDEGDPTIDCFQNLGRALNPTQLTHGELPPQIENLESFVCSIYCKSEPRNLSELRLEMFRYRILEGENLPPTHLTILLDIVRANDITLRAKHTYQTSL